MPKKPLANPDLSLSQIAGKHSFGCVSHLSLQFKRLTGNPATWFRMRLQAKQG